MININSLKEKTKIMIQENIPIELVLESLKKEKAPPGICISILQEALSIGHSEAHNLVFNSNSYKEFGKLNDLFLDFLTDEDSKE